MVIALYSYIHRWWKVVVVVRITTNLYRRPRPIDTPRIWRGPHISVPLSPHYRCASGSTSSPYFHPHNHLSPFHKHTFTITYSPFHKHQITYHPFTITHSPSPNHPFTSTLSPITLSHSPLHHHTFTYLSPLTTTHTHTTTLCGGWLVFFTPTFGKFLHVLHYLYLLHLL